MADQNKTEKATPRRKQKAREQGQIARSRDLIASLGTMVAIGCMAWQLPQFAMQWRTLFRYGLNAAVSNPSHAVPMWRNDLWIFQGVAIAAGISWVAAAIGGIAQGGLVFAPSALSINWGRLNPASRVEQLFSLHAVSRLFKSLVPTTAIVLIVFNVLSRDWNTLPQLMYSRRLLGFTASRIFELGWKSALVLLVWSGADYLLERWNHERELRMSRQDLMDEFKETEGNPAVKMRIRRLQRQVRRRRMLKDVERAAVVITNPTEFAIALEFNMQMDAPVVVAKGRGLLAAQIREVAVWHEIPLVENPPLARALYRSVEIGQAIPAKLYTVVAEILAAIWRAQARASMKTGTR